MEVRAATAVVSVGVQELVLSWSTALVTSGLIRWAHGHGAHRRQCKRGRVAAKALEQAFSACDERLAVRRTRCGIRLEVKEERTVVVVGQDATEAIGRTVEASIVLVTCGRVMVVEDVRLSGRAVASMEAALLPGLPSRLRADGAALQTTPIQQRRATICDHGGHDVHVRVNPIEGERVLANASRAQILGRTARRTKAYAVVDVQDHSWQRKPVRICAGEAGAGRHDVGRQHGLRSMRSRQHGLHSATSALLLRFNFLRHAPGATIYCHESVARVPPDPKIVRDQKVAAARAVEKSERRPSVVTASKQAARSRPCSEGSCRGSGSSAQPSRPMKWNQ